MEPTVNPSAAPSRFAGFWRIFAPASAIPVSLTDPAEIDEAYRHWRRRVLLTTIVGYALFYFVRKNLSVAMPVMGQELGITKADLGLFLTLHGLLYGVSRFVNGFFADRANARTFMVVGLAASALVNVFFGFGSAVVTLGVVWMLNGWVQGMGFPPISHLMTHWFPPKELATKQSIWNTSHSISAGLVVVLCGYLVTINWRPRHQARRRDRRRVHRNFRLRQHRVVGVGPGMAGAEERMGHGPHGPVRHGHHRHAALRRRLEGQGARLR